MSKVQNLAEITPNIPFMEFDFYDLYRKTFEDTELGRIKRLLPFHEVAKNLDTMLTDATCCGSKMSRKLNLYRPIPLRFKLRS